MLYISSSKHEATFVEAMAGSEENTWEEELKSLQVKESSFLQGPSALQPSPLWPHVKTAASTMIMSLVQLEKLEEKAKLTKCLEK